MCEVARDPLVPPGLGSLWHDSAVFLPPFLYVLLMKTKKQTSQILLTETWIRLVAFGYRREGVWMLAVD